MGLDITAYKTVKRLGDTAEEYDYDTQRNLYVERGRENRAGSISRGLYEISDQQFSFCAGSYLTYGTWRALLSQTMLGVHPEAVWREHKQFAGRPFVELIHFSDCEGTLGPEVCAKLAKDFAENADKAVVYDDDGWFLKQYQNWRKAFELAAGTGAVEFH